MHGDIPGNTREGYLVLAHDDYKQALNLAVRQEFLTIDQRLLFSIAQSLLAQQAPPAKKEKRIRRWPLRRAVR